MDLLNYAIDFGNGYVKSKSDKVELVYPSKLGLEKNLGDSSLGAGFENNYDVDVFQRKDEERYVMGKEIERAISPRMLRSTNSSNNRYSFDEFKRLIDFSLIKLASFENEESIDVRLVTGMPSEERLMEEKYNNFKEYLLGRHIATKNGVEYVVNVKELKIIEQPLGTLLNKYISDDFRVHRTLKQGNVVVIDLGSGTTIFDVYQNMRRVGGNTNNSGMIKFYKDISNLLLKKYSKKVDPSFVENGIRNNTFYAKFGKNSLPFKEEFDKVTNEKVNDVISIYESEITDDEVDEFVLTGGGTEVIGDEVQKKKSNFIPVDRPQTATVNGYYKLALSLDHYDKKRKE